MLVFFDPTAYNGHIDPLAAFCHQLSDLSISRVRPLFRFSLNKSRENKADYNKKACPIRFYPFDFHPLMKKYLKGDSAVQDISQKGATSGRHDGFHPKDERYLIEEVPKKNQMPRTYIARIRDDIPPHCIYESHRGKVIKGRINKYECWDIVGGKPTKVILYVREWKCLATDPPHLFLDPRAPFTGKGKTTAAFDSFLMKELLKNPDLTQTELAEQFSLSAAKINQIISEHLKSTRYLSRKTIPCEEIWLIPFTYRAMRHLLVCGIADKRGWIVSERPLPYGPVLLGISNSFSFASALDACEIPNVDKLERIVCPDELLNEVENNSERGTSTRIHPLSSVPLPAEPFSLVRILEIFQGRGYSFERAKSMLLLRDGYTKACVTIREKNEWRFNYTMIAKDGAPLGTTRKHIKYSYYIDIDKLRKDFL